MDDRELVGRQLGRPPRAFRRVVVRCTFGATARREPELAASLARATAEQRRVRRELAGDEPGPDEGASLELGIAGARDPEQLKCLHAHAAFALARPGYELGDRIVAEIDPLWPEICCLNAGNAAV